MPITFDTLEELKAFYRSFRLDEGGENGQARHSSLPETEAPAAKPGRRSSSSAPVYKAPEKQPRIKPEPEVRKSSKSEAPPPPVSRRERGDTLTARIQDAIRKCLKDDVSFTANDIYQDLAEKDDSINKQSVITSVLKQMNSTFNHVPVTERPGNGPRPVKLYNAS